MKKPSASWLVCLQRRKTTPLKLIIVTQHHLQLPPPRQANKKKKFKIPNFEKFRTRLLLGLLALVILIFGWFVAYIVLPKAKITAKTDTAAVTSNIEFTVSEDIEDLDLSQKLVPAKLKEVKKVDTQKSPATGQKDLGTRASGTMKINKLRDSRDYPARGYWF